MSIFNKWRGLITGQELNELLDQGYHVSQVDGALLPPNVIDTPHTRQDKLSPMPTSRTLHIWADVHNTRKGRW